jgi:peroxiredoxin
MGKLRRILFSLIVLIAIPTLASVKAGDAAPALTGPALDGNAFDLHAHLGQVVVVHFLATWCSACQKEMSVLSNLYRKNHEKGVEMIGVSVDRSHDRGDVIKLMHENGFSILMMNEAKTNGFGSPGSLPVTYVIDRKGVVRKIFSDGVELTDTDLGAAVLNLF